MKRLLEIREYQFEHATILVELNRRTKKASFVEWDDNKYKPKDFLFAGRELNYMNGWKYILDAMKYVIDDVKKEMEAWDKEQEDKLIKLLLAMSEEEQ